MFFYLQKNEKILENIFFNKMRKYIYNFCFDFIDFNKIKFEKKLIFC